MHEPGYMLCERYRLVDHRGKGGMGVVWRAYDTELERYVAIKQMVTPFGTTPQDDAAFYRRVAREAKTAASVEHPDVATIFDVVREADGPLWIIMRLLAYPTLQQHIEQHGQWTPAALTPVAKRLLVVIDEIHRLGIIHRDIKPANLMVGPDGLIILDFGIARRIGDTTTTDGLAGTAAYMAPEYLETGEPTAATDTWSLGLVLYFVLTGTSPFQRDESVATIAAVMNNACPPLVGDKPIHKVTRGLLEKDPALRMRLGDAERLLEITATVALPPPPPKKKRGSRQVATFVATSLSAMLVIASGVAVFKSGGSQDNRSGGATSSINTTQSAPPSTTPSSSASPTTSAPQNGKVVGNVFTSKELRVEAPPGWNISAVGSPDAYANLWKEGEGYVTVARVKGTSRDSIVQEQRAGLTNTPSPLSDVSYPQDGMALWTYRENRYVCLKATSLGPWACGSMAVWSAVVASKDGYLAVTYKKPMKGYETKKESDDDRAIATIRAAVSWAKLL